MKEATPTADLAILACGLAATAGAVPILHWRHLYLTLVPRLFSRPEALIYMLKFSFDSALVILGGLKLSQRLSHNTWLWFSVDFLIRSSIIITVTREFVWIWKASRYVHERSIRWSCRYSAPPLAVFIVLLTFIPLISLYNETLHFWTLFVAGFLGFLYFDLAYWQINTATKQAQRKSHGTPFLAESVKLCAAMAVIALLTAICGWWSLRSRRLSFETFAILDNVFFSIRTATQLGSKALKESDSKEPAYMDRALNEGHQVSTHGTGTGSRGGTSTASRRPVVAGSETSSELYATSVSDIHMGLKDREQDEGGAMDRTDSGVSVRTKEDVHDSAFMSPGNSSRPTDPNDRVHRGHAEPGRVEGESLEAPAKDHHGRGNADTPPAPSDSNLDTLRHLVKDLQPRLYIRSMPDDRKKITFVLPQKCLDKRNSRQSLSAVVRSNQDPPSEEHIDLSLSILGFPAVWFGSRIIEIPSHCDLDAFTAEVRCDSVTKSCQDVLTEEALDGGESATSMEEGKRMAKWQPESSLNDEGAFKCSHSGQNSI